VENFKVRGGRRYCSRINKKGSKRPVERYQLVNITSNIEYMDNISLDMVLIEIDKC
jgi:hypothetical protein